MRKSYLCMSLCLSSKCDRGCSHCSANASMDGIFFTPQMAADFVLQTRKVRRVVEEKEGSELEFGLEFTGDGELLLNPDLLEIMDIIYGSRHIVKGAIVTSGVNCEAEEARLLQLLSKPYATKFVFSVSFSLFQKDFPKRLLRTLDILFSNGADNVFIKICLPNENVMKTITELDKLLLNHFVQWARKINPLASIYDTFYPVEIGRDIAGLISSIGGDDIRSENFAKTVHRNLVDARPPDARRLIFEKILLEVFAKQHFAIETEFGTKHIVYVPHFLTKRGRANKLDVTGWPPKKAAELCSYLLDKSKYNMLHLGADGNYYPHVGCSALESLCLGHVCNDVGQVMYIFVNFRRKLLNSILQDKAIFGDICQRCSQITKEYKIFPKILR